MTATPDSCFWGYLDADEQPVLSVDPGETITIEAVTHHSGDAPDLLMDDGVRAIWDGIAPETRTPGVHIMTGPIEVRGAKPGDTLRVELLSMTPRMPYGSNCAANWGLFHERFGKERITIYELHDPEPDAAGTMQFPPFATPMFGFDFAARELYDLPGVISEPTPELRQPFGRDVRVPVRPHLGVMGVAPEGGRRSSIEPGVFGGNVDNWRFGPGATVHYPVFQEGAGFYVGDPHFAQGDGEICGTAIEASLDVTLRLSLASDLPVEAPLLRTDTHWFTHGFSGGVEEGVDGLGTAMTMAAEQMLKLMVDKGGFTMDEAYSLASVAVDMGVTQVVDGIVGCHAAIAHSILAP
ncbi:acetamidase/formamidase family protein [Ilumatobacter nonamiensis]|uniref:acetamidase/formamidase family protein n=1 Tax=Ilumatobacter nonamiensis TaxID=467093 RepID=UPI0019D3F6B6|nr:acetamidase/formamidase family protein [Ilumatobacter nonamiensis]